MSRVVLRPAEVGLTAADPGALEKESTQLGVVPGGHRVTRHSLPEEPDVHLQHLALGVARCWRGFQWLERAREQRKRRSPRRGTAR